MLYGNANAGGSRDIAEFLRRGKTDMSPKELLYIADAMGHCQFMKTSCDQTAGQLQDAELKACAQQMAAKQQELFGNFMQLMG